MQAQTHPKKNLSESLYGRALKVMPGGCSRNTVLRQPHPLYAKSAAGCYITDVEGNKRIDFANNMASLIHGHAHPSITEAVSQQLQKGTAYTLATEIELLYAEHMCSRNIGFDKIRFVNSGTEAVMCCLKASRAFTGKAKIAKVEGAYHGLYDYAEVSQTSKPDNWGNVSKPARNPVSYGTPDSTLNDVVVIPFNDPKRALTLLNQHADELACVLVDPLPHRVGMIPATQEFIQALRQWTLSNNALLVFDEVITFRNHYAGTQQNYNIQADLTAMGKMIGGGFPVGAIAGRKEIMDVMNPLAKNVLFPHSGTFSANPVTMTAGLTAMELFDKDAILKLNTLADYGREKITEAIRVADIPACVTGDGSMLRIHMKAEPPLNYRETFASPQEAEKITFLMDHLFDNGVIMVNTCSALLSTVMTTQELDYLAETLLSGFRKMTIRG